MRDMARNLMNPLVPGPAPANTARRVLVVDDEALVCDSIRELLRDFDRHEVETVTSGEEALVAFQRAKFDLIIIDYEMRVMKGDKLAAAIKALAPQQPILMITAYGEEFRLGDNVPLAVDLVMNKPFGVQEFRGAVRQLATKSYSSL
jgi:two-component system, cell cycle response regulator CpdR